MESPILEFATATARSAVLGPTQSTQDFVPRSETQTTQDSVLRSELEALSISERPFKLPSVSASQVVLLRKLPVTGRNLGFPLYLTVEQTEEGDVLVGDPVMHLYGIATTLEEALADYESMLLEDHEHLIENAHRLAPRLRQQLRYLNLLLA